MPTNRYTGLFKAATPAHQLPPQINNANTFLHAAAIASARHPTARFQTEAEAAALDFNAEGDSDMTVVPAGSQDELEEQIARLRLAFERAEGRAPTERDDAFWEAYNALHDAYYEETR